MVVTMKIPGDGHVSNIGHRAHRQTASPRDPHDLAVVASHKPGESGI
jgi:hypothetical protein